MCVSDSYAIDPIEVGQAQEVFSQGSYLLEKKSKDFSQADIAEHLGVSPATISRVTDEPVAIGHPITYDF